MLRPLHTVIRNLTEKTLIYDTVPRLFINGRSERVLDFDPFTRSQGGPATEKLLIDARLGKVQIIYTVDPQYATIAAGGDFVQLSMAAKRAIGAAKQAPVATPEKKEVKKPRMVPFGKTLDEVNAESVSSAEVPTPKESTEVSMVSEKLDPAVHAPEVTLSKEAAEIVDKPVDLSPSAEEAPAEAAAETKKKRSKKAVTTL